MNVILQKRAKKELLENETRQKKRLNQQINQTHVQRMEFQKAVGKNLDLGKALEVSSFIYPYITHNNVYRLCMNH